MIRIGMVMLILLTTGLAGCTHDRLTRSTIDTAGTVMEIHQRIVLRNLAMLAAEPEALPNHLRIADGVVQINDEVGFGNSGGFTTFGGTDFGIDRWGPFASSRISEQWGSDAVADPVDIKALQDLYRVALGLPPLPDSLAISYLKQRDRSPVTESPGGSGGSENGSSGSGSSGSNSSSSEDSNGGVPIEILIQDVPPPGWFGVGSKHDVPGDARYVARYRDRYAWVTAEGIPALSRLTQSVLHVIKFTTPAEGGASGSRGLAVTAN